MKALSSFETSGSTHPWTQRYAPEDLNPYKQRFETPIPSSSKCSSFTQSGTRSYERIKSGWL